MSTAVVTPGTRQRFDNQASWSVATTTLMQSSVLAGVSGEMHRMAPDCSMTLRTICNATAGGQAGSTLMWTSTSRSPAAVEVEIRSCSYALQEKFDFGEAGTASTCAVAS